MKVQAVTIDFWNTIYDSSNGKLRNAYRQRVLIEEMDKTGVLIMGEKYDEAMKATWQYFEDIWTKEHRTPTAYDCVSFIWKHLDLPDSKESMDTVIKAFEDSVLIHPPQILEGAKEALEALANKFPIALISDTGFSPGTILLEQMRKDGLDQYFKGFSFSNETGVAKPHEKAFRTALEFTQSKAEDTVHIGDIEQTDIKGAKSYGMKAIRYSGSVTDYVSVRNSKETIADHEFYHWDKIVELIL